MACHNCKTARSALAASVRAAVSGNASEAASQAGKAADALKAKLGEEAARIRARLRKDR